MFYPNTDDGWEITNGILNALPNTILMQFTGLKDKNGKEIYESDILSVEDHINMEVLWDLKLGMWITQSHRKLGEMLVNYKCEVIGNIYENDIIKLNKKEGENL